MANKYPYVPSAGPLVKSIAHLRRSFPREVTADTLRKLGVAPKNESYVINVLRFLGIIDDEGKKNKERSAVLVQHDEGEFANKFGAVVKESYEELFELHGDNAWKLDQNSLIQFFRTTDHSSEVVGRRQAITFSALSALSGHAEVPSPKAATKKAKYAVKKKAPSKKAATRGVQADVQTGVVGEEGFQDQASVGLTVRIEVNLPADGDQETYDNIFKSIRKNLIDG